MNNIKEKQRLNKEYGMIYADTDSVKVPERKYTIRYWLSWIMVTSIFVSVIEFLIIVFLIFCF